MKTGKTSVKPQPQTIPVRFVHTFGVNFTLPIRRIVPRQPEVPREFWAGLEGTWQVAGEVSRENIPIIRRALAHLFSSLPPGRTR